MHYSGTKLIKKSHILKFINDFFLLLNGNELTLQRMRRNNMEFKGLSDKLDILFSEQRISSGFII